MSIYDGVPANAPRAMPVETGYPDDSPFPGQQMFVQFSVGLGNSRINVEQWFPVGENTHETLAHIQQLIVNPGLAMAQTLLAAHFQQLVYALGQAEHAGGED